MLEAYCVKCKQKRLIVDPEPTYTSTGTPATKGVCGVCGTKLFRMGKTEAHAGLEPPPITPKSKRKKQKKKTEKRNGKLVIVESPAKARTVGRFLGKGYSVQASIGHVRDLLRSQISVDVESDFQPKYRVPNEKREVVKALKKEAAKAEEIYLATDPDREGEAIAWHLMEAAEIDPQLSRRVVFHEITKDAIHHAFGDPREIDMNLVDSQQARRILDRLVGYNLSPLLWAKVRGRLSAGRVQSAALRLIVDREKEIRDFNPEEYWTIDADFLNKEKPPLFRARLAAIGGEKPGLGSEESVQIIREELQKADYRIEKVKPGTRQRRPSAPFTTSTLQQSSSRRLRFTARKTMAVAQQLYEGIELGFGEPTGLITYMRTDSTQVSKQAQDQARELIGSLFGPEFLPNEPPEYKTKAKRAQEAHEAIRPTAVTKIPVEIKDFLTKDQFKLYELIWQRFLASQMKPAVSDTLTIEVIGEKAEQSYLFRVSASSLKFSGFMEVYEPGVQEKEKLNGKDRFKARMAQLPKLNQGDPVDLVELIPDQHFTQPPNRFSEASLVKAMEEYGIGRPSTYAPILTTLQRRGYVLREKRRLEPTDIGELVNDLIVNHFPDIVDLGFTAKMEENLDRIALGAIPWVDVVREFYGPFSEELEKAKEMMPEVKTEPEPVGRDCPETGHPLIIRHGRYGKFIGCSNFPECRYTEPWLEKIGIVCPQSGGDLVERRTRKGRVFYGCSHYPECDFTSWKRPLSHSCPNCGGLLVVDNKKTASCLNCENQFDLSELEEREEVA
jgi:DNA topoisomerase-1